MTSMVLPCVLSLWKCDVEVLNTWMLMPPEAPWLTRVREKARRTAQFRKIFPSLLSLVLHRELLQIEQVRPQGAGAEDCTEAKL
eukprot:6343591-Amphidinium_carterae.1